MDSLTGPTAEATARPRGVTRVLVGLAVVCAALAVSYAGYSALNIPATANAALRSGYYQAASEMLIAEADKGNPAAQNALGNLYYLGLGVARNDKLASQWYLKAALQAHSDAQINVARHYRLGLGLPRDDVRAYAWLAQARSNQNENAERHMKLLAGGQQLHPHLVQRSRELYPRLEALRPKESE